MRLLGPKGRTSTEHTRCSPSRMRPIDDDDEDGGSVDGIEAGATCGCCPAPRRPGELLTRGDVCHVHADRAEAERCGVLLGDAPELVRLDEVRPAVYRVAWSLSSAASGRLRRRD